MRAPASRATVLFLAVSVATSVGLSAPEAAGAKEGQLAAPSGVQPAALSNLQAVAAASWTPVPGSASSTPAMAPGPGGRLFVAIRRSTSTLVAGFDARGRLLAGWPVSLSGWTDCWLGAVLLDASVRLVCHNTSQSVRAFALSVGGRRLAGWPVDVSARAGRLFTDYVLGYRTGAEPRIVGNRLVILLRRWDGGGALRLVRISANAAVAVGKEFPILGAGEGVDWTQALGADGTGFAIRTRFAANGMDSVQITAFTLSGPRGGWPVRLTGRASLPVVGPGGRVYVVQGAAWGMRAAWIRVYERNGARVAGWSPKLPVEASSEWGGAGAYNAAPPAVSPSGSAWLVSDQGGTTAWALSSAGRIRTGWPYRSLAGLTAQGDTNDGCTTGGGSLRVTPVVGPGEVLYLAQDSRSTSIGGRIVAIGRDGKVRPGWPISLVRPGARFMSLAVAADGTVYGMAIEPERVFTRSGCTVRITSATIVAVAPNGAVRYRRTVVDP